MKFNKNSRNVLWVDDDEYILRKQRSGAIKLDWRLKPIESVDEAFTELESNSIIRGILLDAMMDAGQTLEHTDHRGGLWTGLRFIEYGISEKLFNVTDVVVFTNSGDHLLRSRIEDIGVRFENKTDHMGYRALASLLSECFNE